MDNDLNNKEFELKECYDISKIGQEAEVRAALKYAIAESGNAQAQVEALMELGDCASMLRAQRSRRNSWRIAISLLRARITELNLIRKANIATRPKLQLNTSNLGVLMQVAQVVNGIKIAKKEEKSESYSQSRVYRPVTDDPVADASIANIIKRHNQGEELSDIAYRGKVDSSKQLLEDLKKTIKESTSDIKDAFQPNEDGSVDL